MSLVITLSIFGSLLGDDGMAAAIIVSLIISAIMGYLLWMYYRYAFICETAIIGSIMINHVWLLGSEELNAFSVILTIIIAAAGIKVQSRWLRKMEGGTPKKRMYRDCFRTVMCRKQEWQVSVHMKNCWC